MARQKIFLGTEQKLMVSIADFIKEPEVDGGEPTKVQMQDYDFRIDVFNYTKKTSVTFEKKTDKETGVASLTTQLLHKGNDKYVVAFDTADIGVGPLWVKITAYVPDGDFSKKADTYRTEITEIDTNIDIVKTTI